MRWDGMGWAGLVGLVGWGFADYSGGGCDGL